MKERKEATCKICGKELDDRNFTTLLHHLEECDNERYDYIVDVLEQHYDFLDVDYKKDGSRITEPSLIRL